MLTFILHFLSKYGVYFLRQPWKSDTTIPPLYTAASKVSYGKLNSLFHLLNLLFWVLSNLGGGDCARYPKKCVMPMEGLWNLPQL